MWRIKNLPHFGKWLNVRLIVPDSYLIGTDVELHIVQDSIS